MTVYYPRQIGSGKRFVFKSSFSATIAAGIDPLFEVIRKGSDAVISQSNGNLVLTSGVASNEETIIRTREAFSAEMLMKVNLLLSQRIANSNFFVELVDLVGSNLPFTMNSATSLTVTFPAPHGFDSTIVGQSMWLGNYTFAGNYRPARRLVASVTERTITFTVANHAASGSGTLDIFGWNAIQLRFDGTVATNFKFDTTRNGWPGGDATLTSLTTAAPGIIYLMQREHGQAAVLDMLAATSTSNPTTLRGVKNTSLPDMNTEMYLQIRCYNENTAPASSTSLTVGFVTVEDYNTNSVTLTSIQPMGQTGALPVNIVNSTGTAPTFVSGPAAHDAVISGNPVRIGYRALTANFTAVATGDTVDAAATVVGAQIMKPFSIPEADWNYAAAAGGIINTTAVAMKAAAGAGLRNYLTGITLSNNSATATDVQILDGATVIARFFLGANAVNFNVHFQSPLKTAANAVLNIQCGTTAAAIYANAQGYVAP